MKHFRFLILMIGMSAALLTLATGCEKKEEPRQAKVVKQKISLPEPPPPASEEPVLEPDPAGEEAQGMAAVVQHEEAAAPVMPQAEAVPEQEAIAGEDQREAGAPAAVTDSSQASSQTRGDIVATPEQTTQEQDAPAAADSDSRETFSKPLASLTYIKEIERAPKKDTLYDPVGRIDPFEPLFKERPEVKEVKRHAKRIPTTPLEKIDLSQLKLTAIFKVPEGYKALVEEATGKGYVISKGTYIGLNSGIVAEINDDGVIIEEEVENFLGKLSITKKELRLPKLPGEE